LTGSGISDSSSGAVSFMVAIPIGVFIISDAGAASSSRFHRAAKIVHDHAGIRVHDEVETVITMSRNMQSGTMCMRIEILRHPLG